LIIIAGTVDVDPEQREAALVAGCEHMKETRKLPGCLDYVWSADPLTPGRIVILERWETQDSLEVHFASPHYLAMRDTIVAHGIRGIDVSKHEIGRVEPVYDPQGRPRADFFSEAQKTE
jgi:quinol monooxygenase YgiN